MLKYEKGILAKQRSQLVGTSGTTPRYRGSTKIRQVLIIHRTTEAKRDPTMIKRLGLLMKRTYMPVTKRLNSRESAKLVEKLLPLVRKSLLR